MKHRIFDPTMWIFASSWFDPVNLLLPRSGPEVENERVKPI